MLVMEAPKGIPRGATSKVTDGMAVGETGILWQLYRVGTGVFKGRLG